MVFSVSIFSAFNNVSTVPAGNLAKAALVGAKTVNGPALLRVSTKPIAVTAATKTASSSEAEAFSTIVLDATISALPTITPCAPATACTTARVITDATAV